MQIGNSENNPQKCGMRYDKKVHEVLKILKSHPFLCISYGLLDIRR